MASIRLRYSSTLNMNTISACIITYNEADRIEACIKSLPFCDEIIVVDSGSTDTTVAIAEKMGAKVFYRKFDGFRSQKQFAVEQSTNAWVICMDADEVVSEQLRDSILNARNNHFATHTGLRYARCSEYSGKFLRHGINYPDRVLRLFNKNFAGWHGDREIHEHVINTGKTKNISGDLLHYPYRSFEHHIDKKKKYALMMAEHRFHKGEKPRLSKLFLSPAALLFRGLFLRLGFLDGWQGLVFHLIMAFYSFQKELFLFDLYKSKNTTCK